MVEKIKNLVFRGAAFSSRTSLSLFPSENHRLCLIYGRNGTGKSTISKAFLKIAGKDFPEIMDACLEDYSGSAITYQDNEQTGKVFVFNEEYIQDKVKLKEDGLGMRRMLEAFSTFTYKKGIDEISVSDEILESIKDKKYKDYFRNLMYRLVLNGESHNEERVRSLMDDNDFFEMLSTAEKQRTARDIVCFIYLLNPEHVRAHLSGVGVQNFEAVIEKWCNDIKSFANGM